MRAIDADSDSDSVSKGGDSVQRTESVREARRSDDDVVSRDLGVFIDRVSVLCHFANGARRCECDHLHESRHDFFLGTHAKHSSRTLLHHACVRHMCIHMHIDILIY